MPGRQIIYSITQADDLNRRSKTNALCDLVVLYDYNEKEKTGILIPTEKLQSFTLSENIFGTLPKLQVKFFDNNTYFNNMNFVIGKNLYIKVTPRPAEGMKIDFVPSPYIEAVFTIQDVQVTIQPNISYNYTLDCTHGSMKLLGDICLWPRSVVPLDLKEESLNSKEVLLQVAGAAGFEASSQVTTTPLDSMNWLSTNYTYEQFLKKIISHSWLGEDDAPFYYIDKNGKFYLSSLRTCADKPVVGQYMEAARLHRLNKNQNSGIREYSECSIQNMGFITNDGGNKATSYVFNPLHGPELLTVKPAPKIPIIPGAFSVTEHYRKYTNDDKTQAFVFGVDNRAASTVQNTKYISNDIHFAQNHQFYDIAPLHNKALLKRFFQVFVSLVYNSNLQLLSEYKQESRVKLSDKINIDFTGLSSSDQSIHTGDYIVSNLVHSWVVGGAYSINIIAVRDTLTAVGSLI